MDKRLFELESKFSFQEDTVSELNEIIIRQQQEIDSIQRELAALKAHVLALQAQLDVGFSGDEKPPHY